MEVGAHHREAVRELDAARVRVHDGIGQPLVEGVAAVDRGLVGVGAGEGGVARVDRGTLTIGTLEVQGVAGSDEGRVDLQAALHGPAVGGLRAVVGAGADAGGGRAGHEQVGVGQQRAAGVDVLDRRRDLSRTPGRVVAQGADEVGETRTLDRVDLADRDDGTGRVAGQDDRGRSVGADEERRGRAGARRRTGSLRVQRVLAEVRVFHRQRGRPALAELRRVGEEVRGGDVGAQRRADDLEVVGVEVEERGRATGGEAGELHEGLVGGHVLLHAAERVLAGGEEGVGDTQLRARRHLALAGAARDLDAEEGAERAVAGLGAGIDVDAGEAAELRGVAGAGGVAGPFGHVAGFEAGTAADAQAGIGARDVEEARAVGAADPHVLDRDRLLNGKVGRLCTRNGGQPRRRSEKKALHELHSETSKSFETH